MERKHCVALWQCSLPTDKTYKHYKWYKSKACGCGASLPHLLPLPDLHHLRRRHHRRRLHLVSVRLGPVEAEGIVVIK